MKSNLEHQHETPWTAVRCGAKTLINRNTGNIDLFYPINNVDGNILTRHTTLRHRNAWSP